MEKREKGLNEKIQKIEESLLKNNQKISEYKAKITKLQKKNSKLSLLCVRAERILMISERRLIKAEEVNTEEWFIVRDMKIEIDEFFIETLKTLVSYNNNLFLRSRTTCW